MNSMPLVFKKIETRVKILTQIILLLHLGFFITMFVYAICDRTCNNQLEILAASPVRPRGFIGVAPGTLLKSANQMLGNDIYICTYRFLNITIVECICI